MNETTIAEYKTRYANTYEVQFPLADSDVQTAINSVPGGDAYPFKPDVVVAMKAAADAAVGS